MPELAPIRKSLKIGLSVVLTVSGRLPTQFAYRAALAKRIRQQINIAQSARLDDGSDIRITEFDVVRLVDIANDGQPDFARAAIENATATQNREGILMRTDAGGALAFVIQSALDDDFMHATLATLSEASKFQLTATRPGILIAGFDDLDPEQLLSIAGQDGDPQQPPTTLARQVSKFLSGERRDHVVGVGFFSRSALMPSSPGLVDTGGTAYYFPKRESPFWHDDLSGLFTRRPHPN